MVNSRLAVLLAAITAFAFGGGLAVGQSALVLIGTGTWNFSPNGFTNLGVPDNQIRLKNRNGLGSVFHANGNGTTGFFASRLDNTQAGPAIILHKGRCDPDDPCAVINNTELGKISMRGSSGPSDIEVGVEIRARVIAPVPSDTDMESELCIYATPANSITPVEVVCFSAEHGMVFSNPAHQPRSRKQ